MKVEYIICENKAERDAVLRKLEKNGYIWANGESLTEWTLEDVWEDKPISFHLNKDQTVTWSFPRTEQREHPHAVSAQDYLGKHRPILITRKGRVVTAEDKNSGEKAIATCCPTDTFDFGTGAMIAVARLIAQSDKGITKDAEVVLRQLLGINEVEKRVYTDDDRNFKVGDRVVVRDWGDMAKEYSVKDGDISRSECATHFTTMMKHLCGRTATITDVDNGYVHVEFDDKSGDTDWYFRRWMFNPSDSDKPTTKFKVGDLVTLKNDLEPGKIYGDMILYSGDMFDSLNGKPKKVIKVRERSKKSPTYQTESEWYYSEEMLEPWDENKIHEGDKVYVSSASRNYPYYTEWVYEHITDSDLTKRFGYGGSITDKDKVYEVVKIAPHKDGHPMLAYISPHVDTIGSCHLIDVDGLKKVTE